MSHPALHRGEIEMQRRRGVLDAGGRVAAMIRPSVPPVAAHFIESQPFAIAAILDREDRPWAALWSGQPGFLQVADERTVQVAGSSFDALTDEKRDGSALGLLAIEPETRRRMRLNGRASAVDAGLEITAEEVFSNCPKYIQKRRLTWHAGAPAPPTRGLELDERQRGWVALSDTVFLASHSARQATVGGGGADASHRGGEPGFIRWLDASTLEFADYAGNNLFNTLGNLLIDPRLGLLFVDFARGGALYLTGTAEVIDEAPERSDHPGSAGTRIRYTVEEWFEQRQAMPWRGTWVEASPFNPTPAREPAAAG